MDIREWVRATFAGPEPKVFLELGANDGADTQWMAAIPGVTLHAFEPNPDIPFPDDLPNVTLHRMAIAAHTGTCPLLLSESSHGRPYHKSSSIRQPKTHLTKLPQIKFGETIRVPCTTLDAFVETYRINDIAFIWADVQGAEGDMIFGGAIEALPRARYLYTEYADDEEFEGQPTLDQICAMLPQWSMVYQWTYDVLLRNTEWAPARPDQR